MEGWWRECRFETLRDRANLEGGLIRTMCPACMQLCVVQILNHCWSSILKCTWEAPGNFAAAELRYNWTVLALYRAPPKVHT